MRAFVTLRLGEQTYTLGHGDLIGRLWSAALCVDDPRVSEAHAMVSYRDDALVLLALRRPLYVKGERKSSVVLRVGQKVELVPGLPVTIERVVLPEAGLAIDHPDLGRRVLHGVCSVWVTPSVRVGPGHEPSAQAWLWSEGRTWRLGLPGQSPVAIDAGDTFEVSGVRFTVHAVPLGRMAAGATAPAGSGRLRITCYYDSLHIQPQHGDPMVIGGVPARIVGELVSMGGAARWDVVAREIWGPRPDDALRRNWDANVARLRIKLRAGGVHQPLIRSDGAGQYLLALSDGDTLVDHT